MTNRYKGLKPFDQTYLMAIFIPVNYHKRKYPPNIVSSVEEIAANFGKNSIPSCQRYSLHTEYSFTKRPLTDEFSEKYPAISSSNHRGIPILWAGEQWTEEFIEFVKEITYGQPVPEIIEVHPPFVDTCGTIDEFLDVYEPFEKEIVKQFPNITICIENRSGSQYTKSKFLISTLDDIRDLLSKIDDRRYGLKMAVDYPQLFTAYHKDPKDISMD